MARIKDREKAIALRKQEMSYSQIKKVLGVSKSTLSYWLKDFPLSKERVEELQRKGWEKSEASREKFRITMRKKKEERIADAYKVQKKFLLPLSKRDLFIAGLMLYWGEGTKSHMYALELANTDPAVMKLFIHWLTKSLKAPKDKIKVRIQLYKDMDIDKTLQFWSKTLYIPLCQFVKPQVKKSSSKRINHKGSFGYGTCSAKICNVLLAEKIHMGIKVISDTYKQKGL